MKLRVYNVALQFKGDSKLYEYHNVYEPVIQNACIYIQDINDKVLITPLDNILQIQIIPVKEQAPKDAQS